MTNAIPMHTQVGPLRVVIIPPEPLAVIQRLGILVPTVIADIDKKDSESWNDFHQRVVKIAEKLNANTG